MNKIKISTPKTSLINNISTPPNYPSKCTLAIAKSGANIHIEKQSTPIIYPVIMSKDMTERLLDGCAMDFSHIATLHLTCLSKQAIQIHIYPKMRTDPLLSFRVLRDYGCTITLDQQ